MSLVTNPVLIETAPDAFLPQAIERAQGYLARITGGIGAYSEPQGLVVIRNEVAVRRQLRHHFGTVSRAFPAPTPPDTGRVPRSPYGPC